ncbi:MAG: hypothetical protein OSA11_10335 [Candidatus Nanopelagicales bacterium]|nr:hypothetical protein [Candidatus Nanopelagicales bacterium]
MEAVIFQMGKVASTAIGAALRKQSIEAVQAHIASPERLGMKLKIMAAPYLSEAVAHTVYQDFHQELRAMYLLSRRRVAASQYEHPLLLITPMRDPLTWYWSHFAQMYTHYSSQLLRYFLGTGGREENFQPEAVFLQMLEQMFYLLDNTPEPLDDPDSLPRIQRAATECDPSGTVSAQANRFLLPLRWFDEDFHAATGVDVYEHPFSVEQGFGQIEVAGFNILLCQYEQLHLLQPQLAQFVRKPNFKLKRENTSEDKDIPSDVKRILQKGRSLIPESLVQRINNSKYARHFGYPRD